MISSYSDYVNACGNVLRFRCRILSFAQDWAPQSIFVLERQSYDEMCELGNQIRNMRFNLSKHIDEIYSLAFRDPLTGVKSFSNSPVFRIGGDEFVVVLKGHDYEYRMGLFKQFIETVRQNKREGKVVVAIGMSEYVEADSRIEDVLDRADILMYSNKKQLKQQEGYMA